MAVEQVWGYSDGSVAAEPGLGLQNEADGQPAEFASGSSGSVRVRPPVGRVAGLRYASRNRGRWHPIRDSLCGCGVAGSVTLCVMDARDVAAMTADALNSMEQRLEGSIAELRGDVAELKGDVAGLKGDVGGLKHDIQLLDAKIDTNQRITEERMDRGFQQIIDHIDRR